MLHTISLILILLPLLFQLIMGTRSLYRIDSLKFRQVCLVSIISHIVFSIVSFKIADYNFAQQYEQSANPVRCGMPLLGAAMACFFLFCILLIIILIQFLIKKFRDKKN